MKICLSNGNMKVGKIKNISLPPITTCITCGCNQKCYALKSWRQYPNVKEGWTRNYEFYKSNKEEYFFEVMNSLAGKKIDYFRWHVGGDIPDRKYLRGMAFVALHRSDIKFLCFTKKYDLLNEFIPENLSIVASAWKDLKIPAEVKKNFPIAYVRDAKDLDARIPEDAFECPGSCSNCKKCWEAKKGGSIVFNIH